MFLKNYLASYQKVNLFSGSTLRTKKPDKKNKIDINNNKAILIGILLIMILLT